MPLVSIITSSFNSDDFVEKTIISVLSQTFHDWELIIVDDCSTDSSVNLIQNYMINDTRIKLIQMPRNSGAAVARNAGIEAAIGRYIAFLDSDDLWLPDKLERQLNFMEDNNYHFTFTAYEKIDEDGEYFGYVGVPNKVSYHDLLKTCTIGCLTAMYDTEYFGKIYMPTDTKREDFATWLKILKKIDYAYGLNEILAQYRVYQAQSSSKKIKMAKENWRLYRHIEGFSFVKASYYFCHYAVRGILRTKTPRLARMLGVLK